jgi:hypothetical protein
MTEQPANYAAISVQDSRMEADVESASSGTYSEAASPYWVPVKKAGEAEPQGFSGPVAFCFTINYILGGVYFCWNTSNARLLCLTSYFIHHFFQL